MIVSKIARGFLRGNSFFSNQCLLKKSINNSFLARNISVSAFTHAKEHVYVSPCSNVEIPDVSILEYLLSKSKSHDDRIALVCAETGDEMRYGEVWAHVRCLASALVRRGIQKGSTVALITPNCPEYVLAFLAATSVGAMLTTINSHFNAEEISRQLENSGADVVVFHPLTEEVSIKAVALLPKGQVSLLVSTHDSTSYLNLPEMYKDDASQYPTDLKVNPSKDILVLPYSSGTTGMPKGVMLTHTNVVANLQQVTHPNLLNFNIADSEQVFFGVLPMFHIYGMVACLLLSFSTASKCVTFLKFDPQLFIQSLIKYRPTVLHTVPPILNFLAHTPQVAPQFLTSVHTMACGAAPVGEAIVQQVSQKFNHGLAFQEGYGMTELSPVSHITHSISYVPGSCGKPVPNTEVKILDIETGVVLGPEGGDGELCIRGPQVMKGYYKNDEATAETIDSDNWLHTGDIARVDSKGNFYIVDRLKELIKVKGFQVAPAELEDLLRTYPGVMDVAVIGVPDEKAGELPRAYIVRDPSCDNITPENVQQFIAGKVSAHKQLAGGVVFMDSIPKGMTGKILRKELREQVLNQ